MRWPFQSMCIPQNSRSCPCIHQELCLPCSPTYCSHTQRCTIRFQTWANFCAGCTQDCAPHLTCSLPHQLCLQLTRNFRSWHFINCSRIPSLPMQCRQSLHSSLCMFWFNHTQWLWIILLSTGAGALWSFPCTMLAENVSYWHLEPDSGSQCAIY